VEAFFLTAIQIARVITEAKDNYKMATAKKKKPAPKKKPVKAAAKAAKKPAPKVKPKAKAPEKRPVQKPVVLAKAAPKPAPAPAVAKPVLVKPPQPVAVKPPVQAAAKPLVVGAKPHATLGQPMKAIAIQPVAAPKKLFFKINELIVYPAHGVGKVVQIEEQEIAGARLELYIIDFEKEKLRLKVPTGKAAQKGMRRLADKNLIEQAMRVLRGRARIKRTMWSRRAQEYEAKINSGDLFAVAEVVRDLYRSERQPEQSYSERQLFEAALQRMAREVAAVKKIDDDMAVKELEDYLAKNAHKVTKQEDEVPAEKAA
jgi:CarD family transcriptional regulator